MTHGQPDSVELEDSAPNRSVPNRGTAAPREQPVTWLELFFDLVFVVAFDQLAKRLGDAPGGVNLLNFLVMFGAVWWAWAGNATFAARHGNQEAVYRWGSLVQLLTVGMMALSERGELAENGPIFALAYAANRLILVVMHELMIRKDPSVAALVRPLMTGYGLAGLIWLGSAALGGTAQLVAWGVGLAADLLTPLLLRERHGHVLPHQEHLPERVGLLQIIALGNIVTELVAGGAAAAPHAGGPGPLPVRAANSGGAVAAVLRSGAGSARAARTPGGPGGRAAHLAVRAPPLHAQRRDAGCRSGTRHQ